MQEIFDSMPSWKNFYTIDAHERSTDTFVSEHTGATTTLLGHSRNGHPIRSISIGKGERDVVLVGFPHPNEPVGALMLEYLLTVLAENDFGFRWHIIKCIDPDGARLNEEWFSRPYDLRNHIYHYYRSPSYLQIDWTFPIEYETLSFQNPLPETLAFKKLLDETHPSLLYSLHNSTFGGVYWYLTERCPQIYARLHSATKKQGLPLYLGEPEVPYAVTYDRAIYEAFTVADEYEYLLKNSAENPSRVMKAGTSSDDYARRFNTFSVVCEVPYLIHPKVADYAESGVKRLEAVSSRLGDEKRLFGTVKEIYERIEGRNDSSPFKPVIEHFLNTFQGFHDAEVKWASSLQGFATEAELFDNTVILPLQNTLLLGELWRFVDESSPRDKEIKKEEISQIIEERVQQFESKCHFTMVPIRNIVAVQLETLFACLDYVKERSP